MPVKSASGDLRAENQLLREQVRNIQNQYESKIAELSMVRDMGMVLLHIRDFKQACSYILDVILKNTVARNCSVMLLDRERKALFLVAASSPGEEPFVLDAHKVFSREGVDYCFEPGQGAAGRALQEQKAVLVDDVDEALFFAKRSNSCVHIGSLLSVPLMAGGVPVGVINLSHDEAEVFSKDDVNLFMIVADFVALSLGSALSYERLLYSEEKYRALTENSKNGFALIQEGRPLYANQRYHEITGYSAYELHQVRFEAVIEPAHVAEEIFALCPETRETGFFRCRVKSRQGMLTEVELSASAMIYNGKPAVSIALHDLTEQKKLEQQLHQAQKMEAIGTLAGGIAHDFNNILAAIMGYAEMALLEASRSAGMSHCLNQILKSCQRARDLVKQILAFSRKSKDEQKPAMLKTIVRETLHMIRAAVPSNIAIHEALETDALVKAEQSQLQQVILNLASNAADAMGESGTLSVRLDEYAVAEKTYIHDFALHPGRYVRLSVEDTGTGIDPKALERIFEPFFTTKETGRGTGLGLAVVHGIVHGHGGAITVESSPGRGTTFRILLPVCTGTAKEEMKTLQPLTGGTEAILLVDDESFIVEVCSDMLLSLGYRVSAFESSTEAFEAFSKDPSQFDLIITDQAMPRLTGYELSKRMLALRPDIPIILCTGHSETVSLEKAKESGIREFLMKPVGRQELAAIIRKVLKK